MFIGITSQRLYATRVRVAGIIDAGRHGCAPELKVAVVLQYLLEPPGIFVRRIEPGIVGSGPQDHGHTVVNVPQTGAGVGGNNRTGAEFLLPVVCAPEFPQSGKAEGTVARQGNIPGLLLPFWPRPLVKPVSHDQAAPLPERIAETRFGGQRFRARIDHPCRARCVLCKKRDQSPVQLDQTGATVSDHRQDCLGWGDVVTLGDFEGGAVDVEGLFNQLQRTVPDESTAHTGLLGDKIVSIHECGRQAEGRDSEISNYFVVKVETVLSFQYDSSSFYCLCLPLFFHFC
jgi:hypothetical protein